MAESDKQPILIVLTELLFLVLYLASLGCGEEANKKNRDFQMKSVGEDEIM